MNDRACTVHTDREGKKTSLFYQYIRLNYGIYVFAFLLKVMAVNKDRKSQQKWNNVITCIGKLVIIIKK